MRSALADAVRNDLPVPGTGHTRARFDALYQLGRKDLELTRLAEAHHDARAIAAELDATLVDDALYGVWAASGPEPLVAELRDVGVHVRGVASWCSGVGIVDRALVTASGLLLDLPVTSGRPVVDTPQWVSPAFAATNTRSLRFDICLPPDAIVATADAYLERPGFWHGAIGVAACWAGGAAGLLDLHQRRWRRQDPHALAHLGSAHAWVEAMRAVLGAAGDDIDAAPDAVPENQRRARSVRHVIERTCTQVVDDLDIGAGPEPLAYDAAITARTQQLQLYVRQCHGDRDLEPVGRLILDARSDRESIT